MPTRTMINEAHISQVWKGQQGFTIKFQGHFTHSKKHTRFMQNKGIFTDFS